MIPNDSITDYARLQFMQALATNVRGKNGVLLTDWESQFMASFLQSSRPALWFTLGRRGPTDLMWKRYGGEINHPHPLDTAGPVTRVSDQASPDGCEFWLKAEGRQRRCNEPAALVGRRGLRYCQMHADDVVKNMRREGRSIELRPYQSK
jgi:hypothetical protein